MEVAGIILGVHAHDMVIVHALHMTLFVYPYIAQALEQKGAIRQTELIDAPSFVAGP